MIRLKGILALHILLFLACAVQRAPPGGPVDTTPPGVIRTIPVSGETNVNPDTRVEVMFSEGLIPVTSTEAVYISPFPGDGVKYQWRGKKLSIKFPEPLQPDRTYVISLGTGIKDYRNNAMDSTFTLAFSTGDELDKGEISGQLYMDSDAKGIDVWAYRMGEEHEPNPMIRTPDYIVQCESNGAFRFTYLTQGHYRIFVIRDYVSDRLYQPMEDEIGICYRDVILSAENAFKDDGLVFRIMREDTLGPSLSRARSLNRTHVVVQFDEYVRQPDSLSASFRIMNICPGSRNIISKAFTCLTER